jgi:hypothetical protein
MAPAFSLSDSPGAICDLLLGALEPFGCTSADLVLEDGEPGEQGVTCEIDLDTRVTFHGDRIEVHCATFARGNSANIAQVLERIWSGVAKCNIRVAAKTHSFLFEAEGLIRGASYQKVLNLLAPAPEELPAGTETAVVYYLPKEPNKGYVESSLVINRSNGVDDRLEVDATLVYQAQALQPSEALAAAHSRLGELLRQLELHWIED